MKISLWHQMMLAGPYYMVSYVSLLVGCVVGWLALRVVWRLVRPLLRREIQTVRTSVVYAEEETANKLDNNECCICLVEPKVLRVAVTCGHSYCADCIFGIYRKHNRTQIDCPYCRANIVTIFKAFSDVQPAEKIEAIRAEIREYNGKFGDHRSIKRTIVQLPFVLGRVVDYVFSFSFLLFFIKSTLFLKLVIFLFIYFMLPVDLMPASAFGLAGYIDNAALVIAAGIFALGKIGLDFASQRQ